MKKQLQSGKRSLNDMKVLHIIPSLGFGGAERLLIELSRRSEAKVLVVCLTSDPSFVESEIEIPINKLDFRASPLRGCIELFRILYVEKPDIVVGWLYYGAAIAGILGAVYRFKVVASIHHSLTDLDHEPLKIRFAIKVNKILSKLRLFSHIHYVSNKSRSDHEMIGYEKSIGVVIDNGIDLSRYPARDSSRSMSSGYFIIGNFGRYHSVKNHELFLDTLKYLKLDKNLNVSAVLAGVDMDWHNMPLVKMISERQLKNCVKLLGAVNDPSTLYPVIDVYLLTSRSESAPTVILESLAMGVPVVSTNVGDSKRLISEFGEISTNDPNLLGDAVVRVLDRHDLVSAKKSRSYVAQKYELSIASNKFDSMLEETINNG